MNSQNSSKFNTFKQIFKLSTYLSERRKKQLTGLLIVMIASSISEVILLSSIIPFIGIVSNKETLYQNNSFNKLTQNLPYLNLENSLITAAIIFTIAIILATLLRLANLWLNSRMAAAIGSDICREAFQKTLNQEYETQISWNSSSLTATILTEVGMVVEAINMLLQVITSLLISLGIVITMLLIEWKVALIGITSFTSAYILIAVLTKKRLSIQSKLFADLNKAQFKSLQEGFGAIRDLLMDGNQEYYANTFSIQNRKLRTVQAKTRFLTFSPRYALECISLLILIIATLYLRDAANESTLLLPTLAGIALGSQRILPALQQAYSGWAVFKASNDSIKNVIELLELPHNKKYVHKDKTKKINIKSFIELKNVSYKYPNSKINILDDLHLKIYKNDIIGIIGESGSGKSTLIDLIMGLLPPTKGEIKIDSKIINYSNFKEMNIWRNSISHVPQSIFLADSSILENIAIGIRPDHIDMISVKRAIRAANLEDYIRILPRGLNTIVGEKGVRLSGGQRQRIGIARAIYKKSKILILDEATSALDHQTEENVINSIVGENSKITLLMIAHRLSSLKYCKKIYKVENKGIFDVTDKIRS